MASHVDVDFVLACNTTAFVEVYNHERPSSLHDVFPSLFKDRTIGSHSQELKMEAQVYQQALSFIVIIMHHGQQASSRQYTAYFAICCPISNSRPSKPSLHFTNTPANTTADSIHRTSFASHQFRSCNDIIMPGRKRALPTYVPDRKFSDIESSIHLVALEPLVSVRFQSSRRDVFSSQAGRG